MQNFKHFVIRGECVGSIFENPPLPTPPPKIICFGLLFLFGSFLSLQNRHFPIANGSGYVQEFLEFCKYVQKTLFSSVDNVLKKQKISTSQVCFAALWWFGAFHLCNICIHVVANDSGFVQIISISGNYINLCFCGKFENDFRRIVHISGVLLLLSVPEFFLSAKWTFLLSWMIQVLFRTLVILCKIKEGTFSSVENVWRGFPKVSNALVWFAACCCSGSFPPFQK